MSNKEILNNNEAGDAGPSAWETIDFPEFSPDKGAKTDAVDIDSLAQELIAARKDAKEGATWDKDQRTYVGDDGLPRDWAHLVGYLKKNPDAIKTATETLNNLRGENKSAEEPDAEKDVKEAEDIDEDVSKEAEADKTPEDTIDTPDDYPDTPKGRVEKLGHMEWWQHFSEHGTGAPELVMDHFKRTVREMVDAAGPKVKEAFEMHKAEKEIASLMDEVNDANAQLEKLPLITLPWSQKGREKRKLRQQKKAWEKRADGLIDRVNAQREKLKEDPLDKEEQEVLDMIESAPKLIVKGAEARKQFVEGKLKELDEAEKQLEQPEDKRDMEKIDRIVTHAWMGDEHIRDKIAEQREGWEDYLKRIEKGYKPLRDEQKDAA